MKMKQEHYQLIVSALKEIKPELDKYKDKYKTKRMFYWDGFYTTQINGNTTKWICDVLYTYLNDDHIETALKKAFKELDL